MSKCIGLETMECHQPADSKYAPYCRGCYIKKLQAENEKLRKICQDCVDWFDRISRYQDQRFGHGLKAACQNWAEASEIDMFDFTKMRQALNKGK